MHPNISTRPRINSDLSQELSDDPTVRQDRDVIIDKAAKIYFKEGEQGFEIYNQISEQRCEIKKLVKGDRNSKIFKEIGIGFLKIAAAVGVTTLAVFMFCNQGQLEGLIAMTGTFALIGIATLGVSYSLKPQKNLLQEKRFDLDLLKSQFITEVIKKKTFFPGKTGGLIMPRIDARLRSYSV